MYVFYKEETPTRGIIQTKVFDDGVLSSEQKENGVKIDSFPQRPEEKDGFYINEIINPETGNITFEYTERPPTTEEELQKLKAEDLNNKEAIAELYMLTLGV